MYFIKLIIYKILILFFHLAVTYIDELIGKVLDAVVENDLSENTIISLIGDHGWTLGENQVSG